MNRRLGVILTSFLLYTQSITGIPQSLNTPPLQACIQGKCITVELALTPKAHKKGLMNRLSLPQGSGMLFVFESPKIIPIWMKNTFFPLDIFWIDNKNTVVDIRRNTKPLSTYIIRPSRKATYVLEVNAGLEDFKKIKTGDRLRLNQPLQKSIRLHRH
ncbi:MAG: uncharacterized membrane protein (UPF0127 family) [Candidatus Marinamargulisbacteria bacterium]